MTLPAKVRDWPAEWFELWTERAGIMEFVGGMPRREAEWLAARDIRKIFTEANKQ